MGNEVTACSIRSEGAGSAARYQAGSGVLSLTVSFPFPNEKFQRPKTVLLIRSLYFPNRLAIDRPTSYRTQNVLNAQDPDSDGEVMLDIEVAGAMAPGATIVVAPATTPFRESPN